MDTGVYWIYRGQKGDSEKTHFIGGRLKVDKGGD